jgi:type VI secretion system ImpM family protein
MNAFSASVRSPSESRAALCGKLPALADFVRLGPASEAAREFDSWLVRAVEALALARQPFPELCVNYAYASSTGAMLIGVLAPSQDRMARSFPVAVFHAWPPPRPLPELAALPGACAEFLSAAAALTHALPERSLEQVERALSELRAPDANAWSASAASVRASLSLMTAGDFLGRTLGPLATGKPHYGILTMLTALASVRQQPANKRAPVLDLPITTVGDLSPWLSWVSRALRERVTAASCFWIEAPAPRALLALGAVPNDVLLALARPGYAHASLWPLTTERAQAVEQARETLGKHLPTLTDPTASIESLVDVLSRTEL